MENLSKNIMALRENLGKTQEQFAKMIVGYDGEPVTQPTVGRWERGTHVPDYASIAQMAKMAGCTVEEFAGAKLINFDTLMSKSVMVAGQLQAGHWSENMLWDESDRYAIPYVHGSDIPHYHVQAFLVVGDSMDRKYPEGSIVIVAPTIVNGIEPVDGDIVVVDRVDTAEQHEATLKQLYIDSDGKKWLWPRSHSPEHQQPINLTDKMGENVKEVVITGIVISAWINELRRR